MLVLHYAFVMLRLERCFETLYSSMDNMGVGSVITLMNECTKV